MREMPENTGTASLIDGLTGSLTPVARRRPRREMLILAGLLLLQLAGTMTLVGTNAAAVFTHNTTMAIAKSAMFGGLALGFLGLAFRSFDPTAPRQTNLAIAMGAAIAAFGVIMLDRSFGGGVMKVLSPTNGIMCLVTSLSFSIPMFIALTFFMRGAAPTQPRLTALFIGVASGSWGAFIYALQCPFMNIGYVAAWYGGAVLVSTLAAAAILPRFARW